DPMLLDRGDTFLDVVPWPRGPGEQRRRDIGDADVAIAGHCELVALRQPDCAVAAVELYQRLRKWLGSKLRRIAAIDHTGCAAFMVHQHRCHVLAGDVGVDPHGARGEAASVGAKGFWQITGTRLAAAISTSGRWLPTVVAMSAKSSVSLANSAAASL